MQVRQKYRVDDLARTVRDVLLQLLARLLVRLPHVGCRMFYASLNAKHLRQIFRVSPSRLEHSSSRHRYKPVRQHHELIHKFGLLLPRKLHV